jgi:hypothetical protein
MAHFAELDANNTVTRVLRVQDEKIIDETGTEQEQLGVDFLNTLFGEQLRWVQTSYSGKFRKCFASPGWTYDPEKDVFIPQSPDPSFVFDESLWAWVDPLESI